MQGYFTLMPTLNADRAKYKPVGRNENQVILIPTRVKMQGWIHWCWLWAFKILSTPASSCRNRNLPGDQSIHQTVQ